MRMYISAEDLRQRKESLCVLGEPDELLGFAGAYHGSLPFFSLLGVVDRLLMSYMKTSFALQQKFPRLRTECMRPGIYQGWAIAASDMKKVMLDDYIAVRGLTEETHVMKVEPIDRRYLVLRDAREMDVMYGVRYYDLYQPDLHPHFQSFCYEKICGLEKLVGI